MNDWTVRRIADSDYVIRGRLGDNDCYVDVEAFEVAGVEGSSSPGTLHYERREATRCNDWTTELDQAERFVDGHIKWDGCANLTIGQRDVCVHFCGLDDAAKFGDLMRHLYALAHDLLPRPDWDEHSDAADRVARLRDHYEVSFHVVDDGDTSTDPHNPWIVQDAECEEVAACPSEDVARFICDALNKALT